MAWAPFEPFNACFTAVPSKARHDGSMLFTTRVRLGTLELGNTYRHAAVLAKMPTTMDRVTGDRFVLGLGAGWQVNEHAA
jgi:Luciferase-like monooxygenase